jgi:hypothetical protein
MMVVLMGGCSNPYETEETPSETEQSTEGTETETEGNTSAIQVEILDDMIVFSNEVIEGKYILTFETTRGDLSMEGKRSFGGITELAYKGTPVIEQGGVIQPWNIYTWRPEFKNAWLYLETPTAEIVSQNENEAVVRISYKVKQGDGVGEYKADFDMKITPSSPVIEFAHSLTRLNVLDSSLKEYDAAFGEVPGFIESVIQADLGYGPEMNVFIHSEKKIGDAQYEDQGVQDISTLPANGDSWHWNKAFGWPNFKAADNWIVFAAPSNDKGVGLVHDGSLKWMTHYGPDHGALVTFGVRSLDELNKLPNWTKANEASEPMHFSIFPFVSSTDDAIEEARNLAK